ncbi:DsbE family thiol:disulfide interchange protein [Vibrio sp. 99-8-1]|uniref:DsbE family thiol:disulfide interchange protein n=1 Tax=Vibrio sp. 99-8-1 TaxID=2607602 RepID=UPI0014936DA5|nr:DsbE family thiol:disulfide interchange protein [Vibrio sp. 99-8-1]NOI67948.1 DsbE family thiol:disulfide interchange protein [Vibrio sp. 99-8-1]
MRIIKLVLFASLSLAIFVVLTYALNDDSSSNNTAMLNEPIPAFNLQSLSSDNPVTEKELISDGYKLLNVWASWCGICKLEHSFLLQLNRQGVAIYGLNYRDNKKDARKVLVLDGNPYKNVIFDPEGKLALDLGVIGTPETFVIDSNGKIVHRISGVIDQAVWDNSIAAYFER